MEFKLPAVLEARMLHMQNKASDALHVISEALLEDEDNQKLWSLQGI